MEEEIFSLSTMNTIKCGAKIEVHSALTITMIAFQDSEVKGGKMIITQSVPILPHSLKITYISECYIFFSGSPRKMLSFTFQYFLLLSSLRVCYSVFFAPYKRSEVVWT